MSRKNRPQDRYDQIVLIAAAAVFAFWGVLVCLYLANLPLGAT